MINLRRAQQRYDDRRGEQSAWLTFYAQPADDALAHGFGGLEVLDEVRLPPTSTSKRHEQRYSETITYVVTGALVYEDSLGRSGVLQAGEFRCVAAARGVHFGETNASSHDWTHLIRIGLHPSGRFPSTAEQKRFSAADRRDRLCLIAGPNPRDGELRVREDALVYSALLQPGQHLVHDLGAERRAWLHVVSGEIALDDLLLTQGDGIGVSATRSVSFTARTDAEILLIDVA